MITRLNIDHPKEPAPQRAKAYVDCIGTYARGPHRELSENDLREIGDFTRENVGRWLDKHVNPITWEGDCWIDFHAVYGDTVLPWATEEGKEQEKMPPYRTKGDAMHPYIEVLGAVYAWRIYPFENGLRKIGPFTRENISRYLNSYPEVSTYGWVDFHAVSDTIDIPWLSEESRNKYKGPVHPPRGCPDCDN